MRAILIFHSLWGTKSQDSVHRPQLLKRKDREPKRGIEPKSSIYQPDALPLDQTGSRSKTGEFEVNASSVTSTETVRIIRDGEPRRPLRLSHSSRAALLTFKFSVALRPHRPYRLLGTGSPGRPSGCYGQEKTEHTDVIYTWTFGYKIWLAVFVGWGQTAQSYVVKVSRGRQSDFTGTALL